MSAETETIGGTRALNGGGEKIGLVLSGGGARGAYELGVLSVLAPELEGRGQCPTIIVGTSVGALNASFLAANIQNGLKRAVQAGCRVWRGVEYGDVLAPLISPGEVRRLVSSGLEFLGLPVGGVSSVLDNAPLAGMIANTISFEQLAENVRTGVIDRAAVVATSYDTGRSVVFHNGTGNPLPDHARAIDYAPTPLSVEHVFASTAIEALFPAVEVHAPAGMDGWYGDGGTSLNTPLKPAITFGADRLIVIGLNAVVGSPRTVAKRPADAFDGAAQAVQALLADQLAHDVATLAKLNAISSPGSTAPPRVIPHIFVTPQDRFAVGRLASETYRRHYSGWTGLTRSFNIAILGRLLDTARNPARGELFSYVFFAPEFTAALIEQGKADAQWWLNQQHDDWPWQKAPSPKAPRAPRSAPTTPLSP